MTTTTTNILRQVSLIPFDHLKEINVALGGVPSDNKHDVIANVANAIANGRTTIDSCREHRLTGANYPAFDTSKAQNDLHNRLLDVELEVKTGVATQLSKLERILTERIDKINVSDTDVSAAVKAETARLFNSFKKTATKKQLAEVAEALPARETTRAGDVFGDAVCRYTYEGLPVDFGDLQVSLFADSLAPAINNYYIFQGKHLHAALLALENRLPHNVWLAGERGTGKTEFVNQLAARLQRRIVRVNFDEAIERADFVGGNSIESGSVVWKAGVITQAIQHAGCIILLDEIGFARANSIAVLHSLTERTQHRALTVSETGERIPVVSDVAFFCADNSNGHGNSNFEGVRPQNSAFIDRFSYTLEFDYLEPKEEARLLAKKCNIPIEGATLIVSFAVIARNKARTGILSQPPSLRQLFAFADAIKSGLPISLAFRNAIINKYPSDCEGELLGVYSATVDVDQYEKAFK